MTNKKTHGFALAEVVITLAIFSLSLPTILTLQSAILKKAHKTASNNRTTIALQNYAIQAHQQEWYKAPDKRSEKKETDIFTYHTQPISETSSLKNFEKTLKQEITTYTSSDNKTKKLYSYIYNGPKTAIKKANTPNKALSKQKIPGKR